MHIYDIIMILYIGKVSNKNLIQINQPELRGQKQHFLSQVHSLVFRLLHFKEFILNKHETIFVVVVSAAAALTCLQTMQVLG